MCRFDLVHVLWSLANAEDLERLLRVIERTNFSTLPDVWSRGEEGSRLVHGQSGRWVDYLRQNPHNERVISYNEALHFVSATIAFLSAIHTVDWDFEALSFFQHVLDGEMAPVRVCISRPFSRMTRCLLTTARPWPKVVLLHQEMNLLTRLHINTSRDVSEGSVLDRVAGVVGDVFDGCSWWS